MGRDLSRPSAASAKDTLVFLSICSEHDSFRARPLNVTIARKDHLMNPKLKAIAYWASTILVLLPTAGTGIPELFTHGPAATVQIMHTLGYPLYIMQITGLAKILGAIPIDRRQLLFPVGDIYFSLRTTSTPLAFNDV